MERQSRQRYRTSKHKIKQEIESKKDTATIDKQTKTQKNENTKERKEKK